MKKLTVLKVAFTKAILLQTVLVGLLFTQVSYAIDVGQIHARNDAVEAQLMSMRITQAKAILAGTDPNVSWSGKVVQLKGFISDINTYTTAQQPANRNLAIDASQQLIKELGNKYSKKVYGSKKIDSWQTDPLLANLYSSFKVLKRMEKHPETHAQLYPMLQQNMTAFDALVQGR